MTILRRLELRQQAQRVGRPLKCPLCGFRFAFRHLRRSGKACLHCSVPLGYPCWYRVLLVIAYLCAVAYVMYTGYRGESAAGSLLVGLPFAMVGGISVQGIILRAFPPKLEAHAEGNIWLKLT